MIKTLSTQQYITTAVHLQFKGEEYLVTHRDEADGHFVPTWQVEDEEGEEVWNPEIRPELIAWAKQYLSK